jgi:hypothetical protein
MRNSEKNNDLNHYFNDIKTLFPVYGKEEKLFLAGLMSNVHEYLADNPGSGYEHIISAFGEPKTIVSQYITDADESYLLKRIRTAAAMRRCVLIIIVLVLISAIVFAAFKYKSYVEMREQYINREVTTVIEEE